MAPAEMAFDAPLPALAAVDRPLHPFAQRGHQVPVGLGVVSEDVGVDVDAGANRLHGKERW